MPKRFVCVFGVSGVGKTSLIASFVDAHPSWHSLSASEVLEDHLRTDTEALRRFARTDIEAHQQILAQLLSARRATEPDADWLLDAHSVVYNGVEAVSVPTSAIAELRPSGIVFVSDDPTAIQFRRQNDSTRGRPIGTLEAIRAEQNHARQTCVAYSTELNLKLHTVRSGNLAAFAEAVIHD